MRLDSPLSEEEEQLMTESIGCAIAVHKALGPGFLESIYRKAMCVELASREVSFETEVPVRVTYREVEIPGQAGGLKRVGRRLPLFRRPGRTVAEESAGEQGQQQGQQENPAGRVEEKPFHRRISHLGPPSLESPRPPKR